MSLFVIRFVLDHLATSGAINLGQCDELDAINRCEPTLRLTKSSVTNFKSTPRFTGMYVGQITAAKCRLDLFNSAPVTVTGQPSIN